MYVFVYGSLLHPASVGRTLPGLDPERCWPAVCADFRRTFGVAFPNDGSQPDKWYADADGQRPARILFADLEPHPGSCVNGVLLPVTPAELDRLRDRERRYQLTELTGTRLWNDGKPDRPVRAFLGRPEFTRPEDVAIGVAQADYLALILDGTALWDARFPGFRAAFQASTVLPPPDRIQPLKRWPADPPRRVGSHSSAEPCDRPVS